jgi:hypothetical protein
LHGIVGVMPNDAIEETFWLHVIEIRTLVEPRDVPTLRVDVIRTPDGLVEQTYVKSVRMEYDQVLRPIPRGHGWQMHDSSNVAHTVWRRVVRE